MFVSKVCRGPQATGHRRQADRGRTAAAVLRPSGHSSRADNERGGRRRFLPTAAGRPTVLPTAVARGRPTAAVLRASTTEATVGTATAVEVAATAAPAPAVAAASVTATATATNSTTSGVGVLHAAAATATVQRLLPTAPATAITVTATATTAATAVRLPDAKTVVPARRHTGERSTSRQSSAATATAADQLVRTTGRRQSTAAAVYRPTIAATQFTGRSLFVGRRRVEIPIF